MKRKYHREGDHLYCLEDGVITMLHPASGKWWPLFTPEVQSVIDHYYVPRKETTKGIIQTINEAFYGTQPDD